jgi:hypothetical protein
LKTLGKLFIGVGLALLAWGIFMDTSVESGYGRVINIGLANERLMLVLIGGFVFVGGVILFAVFKAKQTKEDETNERLENELKRTERKAQIVDASKNVSSLFAKDFTLWRAAHAIGIAFLVTSIAEPSLHPNSVFVWLFYGFSIWIVFRPIPHRLAISQGWLIAAIAMVLLGVRMLIMGLVFRDHDFVAPMTLEEALMTSVFLVPAGIFYLVSRRYNQKQSGTEN